jgi:hypothetical protein
VTRKGSRQTPWTTDEINRLRDMAGRLSIRDICRDLKRSSMSVKKAAARLGLSLRCYRKRLVWCDECSSPRSSINADGRCRVCAIKAGLAGREAACAEVMANMTLEQRSVYAESESTRSTRRYPARPRPQKRDSCPVSMYERDKANTEYLLALEEWEYRRLKLPYDAAKTRLRRMRNVTGTNPRKKI